MPFTPAGLLSSYGGFGNVAHKSITVSSYLAASKMYILCLRDN